MKTRLMMLLFVVTAVTLAANTASAQQQEQAITKQMSNVTPLAKLPPDLAITNLGAGVNAQEINVRVANVGKGFAPGGESKLLLILYTFDATGKPLKPVWVSDGATTKKSFHVIKKTVGAIKPGGHEWARLTYFLPGSPIATGEAPWPGLRIVDMTPEQFKKAKFGFVAKLIVPKSTVGDLDFSNNEMARAFPLPVVAIPVTYESGFTHKQPDTPTKSSTGLEKKQQLNKVNLGGQFKRQADLAVTKIVNNVGDPDWVTVHVKNLGGSMKDSDSGLITITLVRVTKGGVNQGELLFQGYKASPYRAYGQFGPLAEGDGYFISFHFPIPPATGYLGSCSGVPCTVGQVIGMSPEEYYNGRFGVEVMVELKNSTDSNENNNRNWRALPLPFEALPK